MNSANDDIQDITIVRTEENNPHYVTYRMYLTQEYSQYQHQANSIGYCYIQLNTNIEDTAPRITERKAIYIDSLHINGDYRGKYYGTKLLYHVLRDAHQNGYRYVGLMDGSDRSGKPDSIYKRIGLRGINSSDDDMCGNIRYILYGMFGGKNGHNQNDNVFWRDCKMY